MHQPFKHENSPNDRVNGNIFEIFWIESLALTFTSLSDSTAQNSTLNFSLNTQDVSELIQSYQEKWFVVLFRNLQIFHWYWMELFLRSRNSKLKTTRVESKPFVTFAVKSSKQNSRQRISWGILRQIIPRKPKIISSSPTSTK